MIEAVPTPAFAEAPAGPWRGRLAAILLATARRCVRFRPRCLVMGHDDGFAREPNRLRLRCATCGRETTGWAIGPGSPAGPVASVARDTRRVAAPTRTPRLWGRIRRLWQARAEARDRQRDRMIAAAAKAVETRAPGPDAKHRADDRGPSRRTVGDREPGRESSGARRRRAGQGDSGSAGSPAAGSASNPNLRRVASPSGLRDENPPGPSATGRRSIM